MSYIVEIVTKFPIELYSQLKFFMFKNANSIFSVQKLEFYFFHPQMRILFFCFKKENSIFRPFFANFDDVTPYQKCKNLSKNAFLKISRKVSGMVNHIYYQYKKVHILGLEQL